MITNNTFIHRYFDLLLESKMRIISFLGYKLDSKTDFKQYHQSCDDI